ncbi:MAG: glutamate-cysteine ligase family protein [Desulfobacterales bacterium]|nr:glutamate-cysteine ligase family protein [Desulfobacterales bacterium]
MKNNNKYKKLIDLHTGKLIDLLMKSFTGKERSYGFEYEFISSKPLNDKDMERVYAVLPGCGFSVDGAKFTSKSGMYITIEPGGQIEYCSPPVLRTDDEQFRHLIEIITSTNKKIKESLGIEYIGTGYIPGRVDAPMILDAERYRNLHARMLKTGTRGREMMKGTASIHLHARVLDMEDIVSLFGRFLELSMSDEFKMSSDRRDIWNNTDPVRCGQPVKDFNSVKNPEKLIQEVVRFDMNADDIGENVPFPEKKDTSFVAFLYHMTTIFTDIRLNMKGSTWELRTLDSQPIPVFEQKWQKFINHIENMNEVI